MAMLLDSESSEIPFWEQHGGTIIFFSIVIAIIVVYLLKKGIPSWKMAQETKKIALIRKRQEAALNMKEKPVVEERTEIGELSDLEMVDSYLLMHMAPPDVLDLNLPATHASPVVKKGPRKLLKKVSDAFKHDAAPRATVAIEGELLESKETPAGDTKEQAEAGTGDAAQYEKESLTIQEYESQKAFILGSAVEYEALGQIDEAIEYYKKAKALAEENGNLDDIELYEKKIKKLGDPWGAWVD